MLEENPLHFIDATPTTGSDQGALFFLQTAPLDEQADPSRVAGLGIGGNILSLETEACAYRGIGMFGVDMLPKLIDFDHLLKAIEINHITIRVAAEAGGTGQW